MDYELHELARAPAKTYDRFIGDAQGRTIVPPHQPHPLSFLLTDSFIPDANVLPNLSLGHTLDGLMEIGESFSATQKIKMFAGYAGWSPGQLEDEMKRKAWLTHPGSLELVFNTAPDQLWQTILRHKGWKYKLLSQMPEDLSLN